MKLRMSRGRIAGTESLGVHWYALNTKANHGKLVAQQIERIGMECLLPLLEEQWVIHYPFKAWHYSSLPRGFVRSSEPHGTLPSAGLY